MRTDDDSWEITESVGATALGVAALRAMESRRADALFRDPYAEKLVRATGAAGWTQIMDGGVAERIRERMPSMAGIGTFLIGRTVYFDDYFAGAVAAGIRQVVILAAGLDARAYRLEWPSGTVVFELDQPEVLAFKANALTGDTPAADRRPVAVDLRQDWPKALRDNGFDQTIPTAWLAEGLLRYLPADTQNRLLADLTALSVPGSRVALNVGRGPAQPAPELRDARRELLSAAGITVDIDNLWYPEEGRSEPAAWFATHGWTVETTGLAAVMSAHGRAVPDAAAGEVDRQTLITAIRQ